MRNNLNHSTIAKLVHRPMEYWISASVCVCVPADSHSWSTRSWTSKYLFEATSVSLSRSNFWPSTGLSSNRQSPESTITPIGVLIITAVESGWVVDSHQLDWKMPNLNNFVTQRIHHSIIRLDHFWIVHRSIKHANRKLRAINWLEYDE